MWSALILAAAFAPPGPMPLSLHAEAAKTVIAVGEPIRVEVKWSSPVPMDVTTDYATPFVDSGGGYERWNETTLTTDVRSSTPRPVGPGAPRWTSYVIGARGPYDGQYVLAFPQPGMYRVVVRYPSVPPVTSNVIEVTVQQPTGIDAEVLNTVVARYPEFLSAHSHILGSDVLSAIFATYEGSIYLPRARLAFLEGKLTRAIWSAPEPVPHTAPVGGDVPAVLREIAEADFGSSVFALDRLVALAAGTDRSGRPTEAEIAWRRILSDHPNTHAGELARTRLRVEAFSQ